MPTNLVGVIVMLLATNWSNLKEIPPNVLHPNHTGLVQVGWLVSNTVQQVEWKGATNEFILESSRLPFSNYVFRCIFVQAAVAQPPQPSR